MRRFNTEINLQLLNFIKANQSVYAIYRKSLATLHKVYRMKQYSLDEYLRRYDDLLYKCALMA